MFASEQTTDKSQGMDAYGTTNHMNITSDHFQYVDYVVEEEIEGVGGEAQHFRDDNCTFEPFVDSVFATSKATETVDRINSNNRSKDFHQQNIVDANDLMMISISASQQQHSCSKSKIAHRYVLTDDEIEPSLQELDDTVASLDGGGGSMKHHRRTHTANSSICRNSVPSGHYTVTTTAVDESSSLTSGKSSVQTEKSHAVLMHRHLIDNMESICYNNNNYHRTTSSYKRKNSKKKPSTTSTVSGSKSISSRNSSTSRRSKISTAQQSYTSHRTRGSSRRPRGPSLERVIFQTLLHTARSDVADAHFNNVQRCYDENDTNNDAFEMENKDMSQKEDEDLTTELILKDLIQADAILFLEVGSNRCLDSNDCSSAVEDENKINSEISTIDRLSSIPDESSNNLLLLPPIATEEEPESLLPTTATISYSSSVIRNDAQESQDQPPFLSPQRQMEELEWEPDFDAIVFPTAPYSTSSKRTQEKDALLHAATDEFNSQHQRQNEFNIPVVPTTTTTITPSTVTSKTAHHESSHSSNEDSPESDIFDHIDDYDDDGYGYIDERASSSLFHDELDNKHPLTTIASRQQTTDSPHRFFENEDISAGLAMTHPRVKIYTATSANKNTIFYETDDVRDEPSSWGFDNIQVESQANRCFNNDRNIMAFPISTPANNPNDDSVDNESIFFPMVLQENDVKPSRTSVTVERSQQQPSRKMHDANWTSFETNPFVSNQTPVESQSQPTIFTTGISDRVETPQRRRQQQSQPQAPLSDRTSTNNTSDSGHQHFNDILNVTASSQDNVSVSSPASVVQQFLQMVDRCPSNKSDNNMDIKNNEKNSRTFDTKCSF